MITTDANGNGNATGTLIRHINDAIAMEQNVEQMLRSMIGTTEDARMRARLERHLEETRTHAERLRERLEAHGESTSTAKEIAARMGAMMKGLVDAMRDEKPTRNARDGYVTEHLEIAAYQVLERVAAMAGDTETAEVARRNRAEERAMARYFNRHWDRAAELAMGEAVPA